MTGAALICRGLEKSFRGTTVLDGIDLDVPAGRAVVLLGTSGAGKTTLLRVIAGLEEADAGSVSLGEAVLSDPRIVVPPEGRGVGMVFQALELWTHMTVAEHIAFGLPGRPTGRAARREATVLQLADEVGLHRELLGRKPTTLSGGEQQRVAIARTLAARPDVILYDEPLANLDPERRGALRALIRRLAAQHGTTLVYVTHDPEEALEIGDEVVVLAQGRVVERGSPQEVYRRPHTLLGARALGPVSAVPATWREGRLETALGLFDAVEGIEPREGAACTALVRPEALVAVPDGTAEVRVEDVVTRGPDWAFSAMLDDLPVQGRSATRLEPGDRVRVGVRGPAAVVYATPAREEIR